MKKNLILSLSLFFALTILFTSCSDAHPILGTESGKNQTVTLKVKSELFVVEANPLRSAIPEGYLCQYVVYKENGEVYTQKILSGNELSQAIGTNGMLPLTFELPNGNYNVAILSSYWGVSPEHYAIKPNNFETDYFTRNSAVQEYYYNKNVYYETVKITVADNQSTVPTSIELKPMWAAITLVIEDAQTTQVPAGTETIEFTTDPISFGFGIKSKLAKNITNLQTLSPVSLEVSTLRQGATATMTTFSTKSGEPININVKYSNNQGLNVLLTKTLTAINVENGNNYKVTGKLGNPTGINNPQMSISLGEFNKTEIVIPFQ